MKTNTPLTLYNKYYDPDTKTEKYQRWVIPAVIWENRKAVNILAYGGNIAAWSAVIYIPFSYNKPTFLEAKEWLVLADKTANWTFQEGDLVVKGEVPDEITAVFTATDLKKKYDNVLTVTPVDTFDMGSYLLRHWKVGAK